MKKLLSIFSLLLAGCTYLNAQNVVNGTVTDKDGNPIPGVKVEVVGSSESVITELDGTFQLVTALPGKKVKVMYVGMQSKQQKITPDMVIKMSDTNWWHSKPEKYQWLVGAQMAIPNDHDFNPSFGLMVGRVKNIGWYVKGVYSKVPDYNGSIDEYHYDGRWLTGKSKQSYWNATAGVIYRLWSPIHIYGGVGYAERRVVWEAMGESPKYAPDCYDGLTAELGLMVRINRFFINGGIMFNSDSYLECDFAFDRCVGNCGVGIYF